MRELEYPFDSKMILRRRKYLRRKLMDQIWHTATVF